MSHTLKIVIGFALIFFGVALLLEKLGITIVAGASLMFFITLFWPMVFVAIGVVELVVHRRLIRGLLLLALGASIEISKFTRYDAWDLFWPLLIVILGISLLRKDPKNQKKCTTESKVISDNSFEATASFGEIHRKVVSKEFFQARIRCNFGSVKIDMSEAQLSSGGAEVEVDCSFGGVEIKVPKHAKIQSEGKAFVGGWEDRHRAEGRPDAPVLRIMGSASFGGVVIKE